MIDLTPESRITACLSQICRNWIRALHAGNLLPQINILHTSILWAGCHLLERQETIIAVLF